MNVDCSWQIREDGKDFVCSIEGVANYKTDVLIVVITNYMQIIYDSNEKYTSNIEKILIDCDYVEVKKVDDENIVKCIIT
ncbi:MAG: hypothetical protein QXD57_07435 [Ignisphaera sp.]